ncbi:hypothetical protein N8264_07740 [Candidatus Thioglobus sp.]|nr:hypothetical protein [Candidatus Thioglobus sp.]
MPIPVSFNEGIIGAFLSDELYNIIAKKSSAMAIKHLQNRILILVLMKKPTSLYININQKENTHYQPSYQEKWGK